MPWDDARVSLEQARLYWLSPVRPDGRPHVTPLIAVWVDERLYFCTGADERKARNIAESPDCVVTTGCNTLDDGFDVVVEGRAVNVREDARLQVIADAYVAKYSEEWRFTVAGGEFHDERSSVPGLVFEVAPTTAFGFGKGEPFSQTRYRFQTSHGPPPGA